jgi:hypothetical protein
MSRRVVSEIYRRFGSAFCLRHGRDETSVSEMLSASISLMMEVVNTSETSVNFYETALRNTPEDVHLQLLTGLGLGQSVTWLRAVRMSA